MRTPVATWAVLAMVLACADERQEADATYTSESSLTAASTDTGIDPSAGNDTMEILDVGGGTAGNDSGDDSGCPCQNVLDGIYVLNTNTPPSVWFFDPPANTFTQVGVLGCAAPPAYTANSMAIDRSGHAWVNYYDQLAQAGKLFRAPLSDLSQCAERPYQQSPPNEWWLLGMGYAVTNPTSSCDQLFVYKSDRYLEYPNFSPGGSELGRYVEATDAIEVIGPTDYPVGELTGTGEGQLFTFAAVSSSLAVLVEFDKDTGAEIDRIDLNGLDITNAFAFAFWGGDVYFFTETGPLSGVSQVTRLDYDNNEGGGLTQYNPDTGIHIAGAGVSTCASFTPPG
jgi:hypothetical protein